MTTRTRARIYRGARRRRKDGACPFCHQVVALTVTGRRHTHRDGNVECVGSGLLVGQRPPVVVDPELLEQLYANGDGRWSSRPRDVPANPWSGKP